MSLFEERLAHLPLTIEGYDLTRHERDVSSAFTRVSTEIELHGSGHTGIGEDVSYDADDHDAQLAAGTVQPLAGEWTLGSFCDHLETLDLWPEPTRWEASVLYRIWAYESAALDLALRQAGTSLHEALDRPLRPLTFVVSTRLGEPATLDPVTRLGEPATLDPVTKRLERYPSLRFKLDPTPDWTPEIVDALVATGAVDSVDFKGHYQGTAVDLEPDVELYRRVVEAFPDAWIEDPRLTDEIDVLLRPHRDRVTWDAPIHGIADIEALPFPPRMVNIKPSRLGPLRSLFGAYAYCAQRDIGMYGGGQFELGVGRGHIQYLAALFHPDTPNDVAPGGYNDNEPPDGLPASPLEPRPDAIGFRWLA